MHVSAATDVPNLIATLADVLSGVWSATVRTATLSRSAPCFDFAAEPTQGGSEARR